MTEHTGQTGNLTRLETKNPFGDASAITRSSGGMMEVASSRESQQIQGMLVIAKKFPRDPIAAWEGIMKACKRIGLAEKAIYAYPRGGTSVRGPSIRLAEVLAQNWGNIVSGIVELEQRPGESVVKAYAWDTQTNSYEERIFTVRHERNAGGQIKALTDPRDIYEMVANQGARRRRACILAVIPPDVIEDALAQCRETMKGGSEIPLIDRVKKMVSAFGEIGVSQAMLEKRLGHKIDTTDETEFVKLREIYTSIHDEASGRADWFDVTAGDASKAPAAPNIPPQADKKTEGEKLPPQERQKDATPKKERRKGEAETTTGTAANAATTQAQAPAPGADSGTTGQAQTLPDPTIEADTNLGKLGRCLTGIKCTEAQFLKWLQASNYYSSPLDAVDELKEYAPKRLQVLVHDWETKYKAIVQKWLADQAK